MRRICQLSLFTASISILLIACSRENGNIKKEYYSDGALLSSIHLINGKEDGEKITYFEDGNIKKIEHYKNGMLEGGYCYFMNNGNLSYVGYFNSGLRQNNGVLYGDSGKIELIGSFRNDTQCDVLPLIYPNFQKIFFKCRNVITHASPFVTLNPKSDTIILGETYSAIIKVNFALEDDYSCDIFVKNKETGNYNVLNSGDEAIYKETPTDTGEHTYEISIVQALISDIPKKSNTPTPIHTHKIIFTVKYYVKSR